MNRTKVRIIKNENDRLDVKVVLKEDHVEGSAADLTYIRRMPISMLKVNKKYQRLLDMKWAKEIADNFNPDLVAVIQVSYRDGKFWIIDGQHTKKAIELKFNDPDYPVICKVYTGLTEKDESELFYLFNKCKKKMASASMLKAQAFCGEAEVTSFLQHTRDAGFIIDPEKSVNCKYGIAAAKKALNCFRVLQADGYDRMLHLLRDTWDGERWSLTLKMLGGMAALLSTYADEMDDKVFINQLRSVTEAQIVKEAGKFCDESVGAAYAAGLVKLYNKGLRSGKLRQAKLFSN